MIHDARRDARQVEQGRTTRDSEAYYVCDSDQFYRKKEPPPRHTTGTI